MRRVLLQLLFSFLLGTVGFGQVDKFKRSLSKQIDAALLDYVQPNGPGAAVGVLLNGKVVFTKGYGMADKEKIIPVTPNTAFRIASLTKQFTAIAIMMLKEKGRLSYNDPLSKFFPELPKYADSITIRNLLTHTSGIPDVLYPFNTRVDVQLTPIDALRMLKDTRQLLFKPGEKTWYSNTGYTILSLVIEKASGQQYADFVHEKIFAPLHMIHSSLGEPLPGVSLAKGYALTQFGWEKNPVETSKQWFGADGMISTVDDLLKWAEALDRNMLVRAQTLKEAFTEVTLVDGTKGFGFGWFIGKDHGLPVIEHSGVGNGYRCHIAKYPDQNSTIVVLTNNAGENNPEYPVKSIAKILLGEQMSLPKARQIDSALQKKMAALYQEEDGYTIDIFWENGHLMVKPFGMIKGKLEPISATDFYSHVHNQYFRFETRADGKKLMHDSIPGREAQLFTQIESSSFGFNGNTTFSLNGYAHAHVIALAGSFNKFFPLKTLFKKQGSEWICHIDLSPGKYTYRFVVDGQWILDPSNPNVEEDNTKRRNNVIVVH